MKRTYKRPVGLFSKTGRVWDIADQVLAEKGKPDLAEVIRRCEAEGLNILTSNTQYSHWKVMNNL